jgi:hypothetical protein
VRRRLQQAAFWLLFLTFAGGLWAISETAMQDVGQQPTNCVPADAQWIHWPTPNTNYHPMFLRPKAA